MRADGLIITAGFTGRAPDPADLRALEGLPVIRLVGSGVEPDNLGDYFDLADAFVVGSSLKQSGVWSNPPDPARVEELVRVFSRLQRARG
jgi:predicted TIM-barrel enzyme